MITTIFNITAQALFKIASRTGLTYNAVNIIVYYMLVPLTWMVMLDFIIRCWPVLSVVWILTCIVVIWWHRHNFSDWSDAMFSKSVDFLLWFNRIGWDYYKASVIICVVVPIAIYLILTILLLI